ncbi:MAG: nucleoside hydrolase [Clostridia bacterium]|nr:nucleoside hydrolase [Clostridia bacterium]
MKNKLPVILDVDTGIDDAAAIVMACYQKQLDVQLITCCFGNTTQSHIVRNTITVLENIHKQNIPVCAGASASIKNKLHKIRAHGINGLGGYEKEIFTEPLAINYIDAMHDIISKNPLTYIIACGPCTNIANFIKRYPQDINKIKLILVTGANEVDKINPYLNFNIHVDIDSCKYVLNHVPNIIFCTSDMGHRAYIPTSDITKTAKYGETGQFLASLYPFHKDRTVQDGVALHDACGVAWLAKPKMFTISYAKAEFKLSSKGVEYLEFDYHNDNPNVIVTTDINTKEFYKWYYKTLKSIKLK